MCDVIELPPVPSPCCLCARALEESLKERDALEKKLARLEKAKDEQAKGGRKDWRR